MSTYLFKPTRFEQGVQDLTTELTAAVALVTARAQFKQSKSGAGAARLTPTSLQGVVKKLFTPDLRSACYALGYTRGNAPVDENYDNLPEVSIMETDVKISAYHHYCRPLATQNQFLPLLRLLDEYLPVLRYFVDQDKEDEGEQSGVGSEKDDGSDDDIDMKDPTKTEREIALLLAQHLWQSVHLVLSLFFPDCEDNDYVKTSIEAVVAHTLFNPDSVQPAVGTDANADPEPCTAQSLAKNIKIDFTKGWEFMRAEILRRQVLFPLSDPLNANALFHPSSSPFLPRRKVERNFISLLFDYQLISPWTPQKDMARWSNRLCDLDPKMRFFYCLQHHLKRVLYSIVSILSSNEIGIRLVTNGGGLLVHLQQHWNNVVNRFKLKETVLAFDFASESAINAAADAEAEYKSGLKAFLDEQPDGDFSFDLDDIGSTMSFDFGSDSDADKDEEADADKKDNKSDDDKAPEATESTPEEVEKNETKVNTDADADTEGNNDETKTDETGETTNQDDETGETQDNETETKSATSDTKPPEVLNVPTEFNYRLNTAASSNDEAFSQIAFCVLVLSSISYEFNRYLIRPDGALNLIAKKTANSSHPNIYPVLANTLPDFQAPEGDIEFDELRSWASPDGELEHPFLLYPEQEHFLTSLYIYQVITFCKMTLLYYRYTNIDPGNNDWYWKTYTTANINNVSSSHTERIGANFLQACDILFSAIIRTGGFVSNRVLFGLLFTEDTQPTIPQVNCQSDQDIFLSSLPPASSPTPSSTLFFNMPEILPLALGEFDLAIGLIDAEVPDEEVMAKSTLITQHSRLSSSSPTPTFTHSFMDLLLQHHLHDTTTHYYVPKSNVCVYEDVDSSQAIPLEFPVPSLLFFTASVLFGSANQVLFTYERRYQALYRYLLLDQRWGLLMEQAMLSCVDATDMDLLDQGPQQNRPNWVPPCQGSNSTLKSYTTILSVFAQGMDAGRMANWDGCGVDGLHYPSLRSWTDPVTVDSLPTKINSLSHRVAEWKLAITNRQALFRQGEFAQQVQEMGKVNGQYENAAAAREEYNTNDTNNALSKIITSPTTLIPVFKHKFISSYNIIYKEQLAAAYKAFYQMQMDMFHQTNLWSILGFLVEQQYQIRNIFLHKMRSTKSVFIQCRLTGIPIPLEKENLGNARWYYEDAVLPDSRQHLEEEEQDSDSDEDEDAPPQREKYVYRGIPKTQAYNWIYFNGQLTRHDDLPHEQGSMYVIDGLECENDFKTGKPVLFESPIMLKRAAQALFGRRYVSENEVDDNDTTNLAMKILHGYTKHIGDMIRTGVAREVVAPHFDLAKSFLITAHTFNMHRTFIYRLCQIATTSGWSTPDEDLLEIMLEMDYVYRQIIKGSTFPAPKQSLTQSSNSSNQFNSSNNNNDNNEQDVVTQASVLKAAVLQRTEFLISILHGASNFAFSTPYGGSDSAWGHYYPKVDLETGEETIDESFVDDRDSFDSGSGSDSDDDNGDDEDNDDAGDNNRKKNDKNSPWSTWPDGSARLNIFKIHLDYLNGDSYDDFAQAVNGDSALLRLVGRVKKLKGGRFEKLTLKCNAGRIDHLDASFLLRHKLLDDTKRVERDRWRDDDAEVDSGSDDDDDDDGNGFETKQERRQRRLNAITPLATTTPAFMVQYAIESFIEMMLDTDAAATAPAPATAQTSITLPSPSSILSSLDLTAPIPTVILEPLVQVTADNAVEVLGKPFPVGSKMMIAKRQPHFGFYYPSTSTTTTTTASNNNNNDNKLIQNPFDLDDFQPSALVSGAVAASTGLPVYSQEEQRIKLNKLARQLATQLDQQPL